jgi:hypothetical protein
MLTPQSFLGGALSAQGLAYAIGGSDVYPNAIATVEAYDPNAGFWSFKARLHVARQGLGAATGLDGRIYAIGGGDSTLTALTTNEAYSAFANSWTVVAPMPTPRIYLAIMTGGNGLIYAIGGATSGFTTATNLTTVEAYNPATGSWSTRAPLLLGVQAPAAAVGVDGRIYVFGGISNASFPNSITMVQVYSPITNTWSFGTPMPTATSNEVAVAGPNGRLFVIGGSTNFFLGSAINTVQSYNPAGGFWTTVVPSGAATATRSNQGVALPYSGVILVYGGVDNAFASVTTNQGLSTVGGFAGSGLAKSPNASLDVVDPSMLSTTDRLSAVEWVNQGDVADNGASDSVAPQDAVDTVFADGTDSLSADLADTLI